MEYKVGDKVMVKDGEKSYVVEITNKYNMKYIICYDGIRLFDKSDVYFEITDIEYKIEKEEVEEDKFKIGDNVLVKTFNGDKIEAIIEKEIEHYEEGWFKVRDKNKENCFYVVRYEDMKKIEEKKYLKTWEAIKALEEGYKVRVIGCEGYLRIDEDDILVNELGDRVNFQIDGLSTKLNWEIYEEPKKEIPKEFEGLKYILGSINNMDCGEKDCDKCPLGMEKCDMLDEVFFDMKEKYNF